MADAVSSKDDQQETQFDLSPIKTAGVGTADDADNDLLRSIGYKQVSTIINRNGSLLTTTRSSNVNSRGGLRFPTLSPSKEY